MPNINSDWDWGQKILDWDIPSNDTYLLSYVMSSLHLVIFYSPLSSPFPNFYAFLQDHFRDLGPLTTKVVITHETK